MGGGRGKGWWKGRQGTETETETGTGTGGKGREGKGKEGRKEGKECEYVLFGEEEGRKCKRKEVLKGTKEEKEFVKRNETKGFDTKDVRVSDGCY